MNLLSQIEDSDPRRIFTLISRARKEKTRKNELLKVITEEYDDLSKRLDRSYFQVSAQVRNNLKCRKLADLLIDQKGELKQEAVKDAIQILKKFLYPLNLARAEEGRQNRQILRVLEALPVLWKKLRTLSKPLSHKQAEDLIRHTLGLRSNQSLTDADARRAALAALMTDLRQSVGSCFATAPCLILHNEQPEQFLQDLNDLLNTGRMKRVFEGIEYTAPLCPSSGVGDLRRPILLDFENQESIKNIGFSPGILQAFESASLIDHEKSLKERVDECRNYIQNYFSKGHSGPIVTAEGIIKGVLLKHFNITEEVLNEFLNRPREMIFGGLMMAMSHSNIGQKGIGEACSKFLEAFENGKKAFVALADNSLLKAWEFSVASFAETKDDFAKWNLYISLGLSPEEEHGIGHAIYNSLKNKLDETNRKVQDHNHVYETLYGQLKFIEGRMRSATTEKEINWMKAEYQARLNEFSTFEEMRNREQFRAERLANLFNDLIDTYLKLFPKYFQEIYDPEMHDVGASIYDDRPAGFRLLYKHGRMNTSQWSRITNPQEFVEALSTFFVSSENELLHQDLFEGLGQDLSEIVTLIVNHVKTKSFLESAFYRMAVRHNAPLIKNPLENLDKVEKKPWAYTSGGSIEHLLMCYFRLNMKPKSSERWVENEVELLVFLADTLKKIPYSLLDEYVKNPYKAFLIHSPTHAFLLNPGLRPFDETWKNEQFTYTFIRDQFIIPMERFHEEQTIGRNEYERLVDLLKEQVPINFRPRFDQIFFQFPGKMNPYDMRKYFVELTESDLGLSHYGRQVIQQEQIDKIFLENLPLLPYDEALSKGRELVKKIEPSALEIFEKLVDFKEDKKLFSPKDIFELILSSILLLKQETLSSTPYLEKIIEEARKLKMLPPSPLFFADTNWPYYQFAFLVGPGTGKLELWVIDSLGLSGRPMGEWREWLNGSNKQKTWGIFTEPVQYIK